ncbi:urease accessory protein UreD [Prochlorococcus sp. MIT 1307]|uniref:urease accessory protein UreD n=1 Tax=Prochlorococcus sp. MIT 1307 TaxID=3096219 RepID=UPI002A74C7BD|nr:urease accessory protein UreD [Prochlorococcus sp. MIT 1307]
MSSKEVAWHGTCDLRFIRRSDCAGVSNSITSHQVSCSAPFKVLRGSSDVDGRFEVPLLHTAGGLVGGDQLTMKVKAESGTSGLITTVAAQKVYGSIGISTLHPEGEWAKQNCYLEINKNADLEWLPQEIVLFGESLFEQTMFVDLHQDSSFICTDIVRLGRTAAGEMLGSGCWRSHLEICRHWSEKKQWEFVDRLELAGNALSSEHGMGNQPVFGSMVWVAPTYFSKEVLNELIQNSLLERVGLEGGMSCSALDHGISARYIGPSTQAARFWFFRIWRHTRRLRQLSIPEPLRVWPMQEKPYNETMCNTE